MTILINCAGAEMSSSSSSSSSKKSVMIPIALPNEKIKIHSLLINEENSPKIIGAVVQTHNLFVIGQRDWEDINMYYSLS